MTTPTVPLYQAHLSPNIPTVIGNKDYQEFRAQLERIDELLIKGGVEQHFVQLCMAQKEKELVDLLEKSGEKSEGQLSARRTKMLAKMARRALRCTISRELTGQSYRDFTNRLADSYLFQRFCLIDQLAVGVHLSV